MNASESTECATYLGMHDLYEIKGHYSGWLSVEYYASRLKGYVSIVCEGFIALCEYLDRVMV